MSQDPTNEAMAERWSEALDGIEVRHPNGISRVVLVVSHGNPPSLYVGLDKTWCTMTGRPMVDFAISSIALRYWPGLTIARKWFAAAWSGYCQHEALELVTAAGDRSSKVLDPHSEPYATNPANRGLRCGFPVELTNVTMLETFMLVMPTADAEELMRLA